MPASGNHRDLYQFSNMPLAAPVIETRLNGVAPHRQGKVRDIYEAGDELLLVATDRISAFDYVLGSGIPDKGKVLTQLSAFWFEQTRDIVPNHLISLDISAFPPALRGDAEMLAGRSMLVRKTNPIPIECVARGYLSGSGWKDYRETGSVCGVPLPGGLRESDRLPAPIFTPATKATSGHDVNVSQAEAGRIIGDQLVATLRELTLELYAFGAAHAETRGIILADTKFEFGLTGDGIMLIDEAMTPDSSRYWPKAQYEPGGAQPSFDKQYVRDYLEQISWNKQPPVPSLPDDVVQRTREKYVEAFRRLTGKEVR
jgi:phosphoribosylaminoimidazole-succinocarboxamide synthase